MAAPKLSTEDVARRIARVLLQAVEGKATHSAPPGPGYLGLEPMTIGVDYQMQLKLGEAAVQVMVAPGSPAQRAGICNRDYVLSIDGRPFAEFNASKPPAGAVVAVTVIRERRGTMLFEVTLAARRKENAVRPPSISPAPCGEPIARDERFKWSNKIGGDPRYSVGSKALAARLVNFHLSRGGIARTTHRKLAGEFGRSARQVQRWVSELQSAGMLQVTSGRAAGEPNVYRLTWPAEPGGNVVYVTPKSI